MSAAKGVMLPAVGGVLVASCLAGCAAPYDLHSNLTEAELRTRLDARIWPGMHREEFASTLMGMKISRGPAVWRDAPPGFFLRLYPPGGYWISSTSNSVDWIDVEFAFDDQWKLVSWRSTNGGMRYVGYRPYAWNPEDGPVRYYPAQPPPPRDWRPKEEVAGE